MALRRGSDSSDSSNSASWMDYSIRMHLRRHGSGLDGESSEYTAMRVPPEADQGQDDEEGENLPVLVAKLVDFEQRYFS